ncbi:MAG: sulfurtransferase [Polyangiaceae bacterium]|nr:sulfurtransferase [Polyangiaceae bacterium]
MFETLISADELVGLMEAASAPTDGSKSSTGEAQLVIVDCRFTLGSPEAGAQAYAASHIPGAIFADLEKDLSGPIIAGKTGRHPLPDPFIFWEKLESWGISEHTQVVAYDDVGGAFAARLWWLLGWLRHPGGQAVLDGGWSGWLAASGAVSQEPAAMKNIRERKDAPRIAPKASWLCTTEEVEVAIASGNARLFDARAVERYAGEVEPIDRIPGHIPTAQSLPFGENLNAGKFRTASELRARFQAAGADTGATSVMYCGSGVTACHNVLAAAHAGLPLPRLYAGSYSEWITHPKHAVNTGRRP